MRRGVVFTVVGGLGIAVQIATLALFDALVPGRELVATMAAVGAAVVHNFVWHLRWTWRDRRPAVLEAFTAFAAGNGALSLAGNLLVMDLLVGGVGLHPIVANLIAIGCCALANYWLADRIAFRSVPTGPAAGAQ